MKRVLVIANLFHASPRIPGLTSYFGQSGWCATILTPPFSAHALDRIGVPKEFTKNVDLLEAPFAGDIFEPLRKLIRRPSTEIHQSITEKLKKSSSSNGQKTLLDRFVWLAHLLFAYPDTEKTWIHSAIESAEMHLRHNRYDAILSSSPFPTNHIIAQELKKKYSIPWCADFRDPWTQNHTYHFPLFRKIFEERLEKRILREADAIVTAAPAYSAKQTHFLGRTCHTIFNGFDPSQYQNDSAVQPDQFFSITYTGTIYPKKQNPIPFLDALQALIQENRIDTKVLRVTFYGKDQQWLAKEIEKRGLQNYVITPGPISRQDVIKKQRSSQVLLLLGWEDPRDGGVYPSKLFEYLGARRPILIVGGSKNEEIKKLVDNISAGSAAVSIEEIKDTILRYYDEYKNKGSVSYDADEKKIMAYSFDNLAKQYCNILNAL